MKKIKFSRFLKYYENENKIGVFHQIYPDPIILNKDVWRMFKNNPLDYPKLIDIFVGKKLIASKKEDGQLIIQAKKLLTLKLNHPTILYLMMAQHCNLFCSYCPIPGIARAKGNSLLSINNAIAGINLWFEHIKSIKQQNPYYLIFYGGEPLLNFPVIEEVLEYLSNAKSQMVLPEINLMIVTNGLLLTRKIMELFKKNKVTVSVGIDGFDLHSNMTRQNGLKTDVSNQLISKIKIMVKLGIDVSASVSITEQNIDFASEFSNHLRKIGIVNFGFNFLRGKALGALKITPKDYLKAASLAMLSNYNNSLEESKEAQVERKVKSFMTNSPFPVECTCYGNQIVIQADGNITNCPFYRNDIAHISEVNKDFRIWDTPQVKQWRKRLPLFNDAYLKEKSMSLSGGGCAWGNIELMDDPLYINKHQFIFSDIVLKNLIFSQKTEGGIK